MKDRELGNLSREELTDVLLAQMAENERLKRRLKKARAEAVRRRRRRILCGAAAAAAAAALITAYAFPILRICGSSMSPTLNEGDVVIAVRGTRLGTGDLVSFCSSNQILVKRYIAGPWQWLDIDKDGNVYIDGAMLDEPYLEEKALGDCEIELPSQVPDGRIFVMGDSRATSIDSRSAQIGYVSSEQLVGKIVFRIWPLSGFGAVP